MGQGLPMRLRWHHDRSTPDSCHLLIRKKWRPDREPGRPSSQNQPTETVLLTSWISLLSFAISLRRSGNLMTRAVWQGM